MKLLFAGDLNWHGRTAQRCRAFEEVGVEVMRVPTFPIGQIPGVSKPPTLLERAASKAGVPFDTTGANRRLVEIAAEWQPDVVWLEKGIMIRAGTLRALRRAAPLTRIASYSEDPMCLPQYYSWHYRRGLREYDVVFTPKQIDVERLPALGARRVARVDMGYDPEIHRPMELSPEERARWGADVAFTGTYEAERALLLLELARSGAQVRVWGHGWQHWRPAHPNLRVEKRPAYHDDYARVISASRINLGFLRAANFDLHTCRSVEIPACGAFMLAERSTDHERMFVEAAEVELFSGRDELIDKTHRYLNDEDARARIAAAGRERCVRSGYSHAARAVEILAALGFAPRAARAIG